MKKKQAEKVQQKRRDKEAIAKGEGREKDEREERKRRWGKE